MTTARPGSDDFLRPGDVVDLEPTIMAGASDTAANDLYATQSPHLATPTSMVNDTSRLLQSRLLAVALLFGIYSSIRYLFSLFAPDSGEGLAGGTLITRAIFSFVIAGLLYKQPGMSYRRLRVIEYVFFGLQTIAIVGAQYFVCGELIGRGDIPAFVAFEKNGVFRMIMLMLLYGVLIPNDPKVAARAILTMALAPMVSLAALHATHAEGLQVLHDAGSGELAMSDGLFVLLGGFAAIYAAYIVHGLRRELHDARHLGQYVLGDKLGEGGMGEVYMAEHQLLKRPCALKLIHPDIDNNPIAMARFEREVQSAAALSHPNTIQIYDYGHTPDGTFYYVMELLPGMSLAELVDEFGALPPGRTVYIMRQVCKSLAEAHRMGMVHRDLKPANIFVAILGGQCDVAKVLDFGLVKVAADQGAVQLTADYTVSGTPSYMSPEQATGSRDVDGRADIYALGAILYFSLAGRPPFEKETPVALMVAHASEPVPPLPADVPADLAAIVARCLSKKADERFADTDQLAAALAACQCAGEWNDALASEWWLERANLEVATAIT